jgi:hypothetical protein
LLHVGALKFFDGLGGELGYVVEEELAKAIAVQEAQATVRASFPELSKEE